LLKLAGSAIAKTAVKFRCFAAIFDSTALTTDAAGSNLYSHPEMLEINKFNKPAQEAY